MNCYDCHHNGKQAVAVAVCHGCGDALCPDHATEATHHLTVTRALNRSFALNEPT